MDFEEAKKIIATQQYRKLRESYDRKRFGRAKAILRRAGVLPKGRFPAR